MKILFVLFLVFIVSYLATQEAQAQVLSDSIIVKKRPPIELSSIGISIKKKVTSLSPLVLPYIVGQLKYNLSVPAFKFEHSSVSSTSVKWKLPTFAIGIGIACKLVPNLREFDRNVASSVQESKHRKFPLDDYLQYAPLLSVFALDQCGIPAKHSLKERLVLSATSYAIMAGVVNLLKYTTKVRRPDNSNFASFPSGHTATAFVGAHLLYKEYKDRSMWIPIVGYGMAGLTGALRVYNNKHWVSDVLAGVGIGILSVELAYKTMPFWRRLFKLKSNKSFALAPTIGRKQVGAYACFRF